MEFYLSGSTNFRKDIATIKPYKGNRPVDGKPFWYKEIREYLQTQHYASIIEGQEADDEIGIRATEFQQDGVSTCIVSTDKDLKQIPGHHYNWVTTNWEEVSEVNGRRKFYQQLLVGDSTDNIPGLRGVGEVGADRALAPYSKEAGMFHTVRAMYHEKYGPVYTEGDVSLPTDEAILQIGQLLYIRRKREEMWNFPGK